MLETKTVSISLLRKYWAELVIVAVGSLSINLIFLSKAFRQSSTVSPEAAAQLGSFVGGYVGSVFVLISIVLLFITLKNQIRSSEKEKFETKYFELLKMHRDNVAEVELGKAGGRKLFVLLLREFRSVLEVLRAVAMASGTQLTRRQEFHISYYCLFFGVGPNSSRMLKISLADVKPDFVNILENELNKEVIKTKVREFRNLGYTPFEGHQSRLGHYYRHLYQLVRFVDQQKIDIQKYEYAKTVRAQLSTHEQALLFLNSLTPMGSNWWTEGLIEKYRLVQNIPREFFDSSTELDLATFFKPGYFEWEEVAA